MESDTPIACSLGATDLSTRLAEMTQLGQDALLSADRDNTLTFRADSQTRSRLEAIVAGEADCCPFLELSLREDRGALVLEIGAPDGAEPVVADLVSAFEAAR